MKFHTTKGAEYELKDEDILLNDVILPGEYNPHNVRPWLLGAEYRPHCLVWASHEQDAFDAAVDAGKLDGMLIEPEDEAEAEQNERLTRLGNAGEPFDLTNAWIDEVDLMKNTCLEWANIAVAANEGMETLAYYGKE